ncbi:MAG: ATP-binding cassette domain-containing protein, partial [Flavobacteriales bacterium]|nr:ATP-binding cassette domain-containing protein [Flavobacteriales bacterium]
SNSWKNYSHNMEIIKNKIGCALITCDRLDFFEKLKLRGAKKEIADRIIKEIISRLKFLNNVGLDYLSLHRSADTLSGGEAQRVKLASELTKRGTGKTLYLLDEPSTGLHFEDIKMLLLVLQRLVDEGNTVLVIEHNMDIIKTADYIVDLGPEGGEKGGKIIATGTPEELVQQSKSRSYTAQFLEEELKSNSAFKKNVIL